MTASRRILSRRASVLPPLLVAITAVSLVCPGSALPLGGQQPVSVSVEGEVRKPGAYVLPPGSPLSSLLYAAGGFTDNAFPSGAVLTRSSAKKAQEAELRETTERLSRESADTGGARDAVRPAVELLSSLSPSGRIPVRLSHPRLLKGSPADLPLEEGDALRVPPKVDAVAVAGAVRAASRSIPHTADLGYQKYIRHAGGYADDADRGHVYLLRADGTTALLSLGFISWNPGATRWELTALTGSTPTVGPGDTIVVPRPPPQGLPSKVAREIPGILMRAAEIAGGPVILP